MNHIKKITLLLILSCIGISGLWAATQINQTAVVQNFAQPICVKAFDRATGTFYVGVDAANGAYSIARATRNATTFEGIATAAGAQGAVTQHDFALINNGGGAATHVAFKGAGAPGGGPAATDLKVMRLGAAGYPLLTAALGNGAREIIDANGVAAHDFTYLAGGEEYVFLRVNPVAVNARHSGILAFRVDGANALARIATAAGNAAQLDDRRGAVAGDGQFLRNGSASAALVVAPGVCDMYWDEALKTLFVCASVTTERDVDFNMAISKVRVTAGANPVLEISDVLPNAVNAAVGNDTTIFATSNAGVLFDANDPCIFKIRTMHTSTGRTYLIVNGGVVDAGNIGNQCYCLQYDEATGFVTVNNDNKTALINDFILTGGAAPGQSLDGGNVGSLVIGGRAAPWAAAHPATDMDVVGDTVYVSQNAARDANNDPGVWSSRALFDHQGVIIRWTPWERVFKSENDVNNADKAHFIAVDGKTGVVWQVNQINAGDPQVVRRTTWSVPTAAAAGTGLASRLNSDLAEGCTAVLDLPMATPGLGAGANVHNSFALFGGNGKMVFAQTKYGNVRAETVDFSQPTRYKVTTLAGAGYVRALGYSRVSVGGGTNNYFFAGTDNGLYVWAVTAGGAGYNHADGFTDLTAAPFDVTRSWQKMTFAGDNITGAVTAIEANGTHLFVVEQDVSTVGTIVSKLHRIQIAANVGLMGQAGATHAIIAQSGLYGIPDKTIFTGFAVVSDAGARDSSFGLLTTSAGLYGSGGAIDVLNPALNAWVAVDATKAFTLAKGIKRVPTGVGADVDGEAQGPSVVSFANEGSGYWQKSAINNVGIDWTAGNAWNLSQLKAYVNASAANGGSDLTYLDRLTTFWTDGGRRLFATYDPNVSGNTLQSMPFATTEWDMSGPEPIAELADVSCINWIENISGSGILMVGTDKGVATLE